jgi:hypothetical protein
LVRAGACADLGLLWTQIPPGSPSHVFPLVGAAVNACRSGATYSLGYARSTAPGISTELAGELATKSDCHLGS